MLLIGKRYVFPVVAFIISLLLILGFSWTSPRLSVTGFSLPNPQAHPLPLSLAQWQDATGAGDYFAEVKLTPVEYLVWFEFPVKIYLERPTEPAFTSASAQRFHNWVNGVLQAVAEWSVYLPLEVVSQPEEADITVWRSQPSQPASFNRETGKFELPRVRSAETRYEFYLRPCADGTGQVLAQKFTIQLSPAQTVEYTIATARHELGHALGIWGHSQLESDVMHFSQVSNPPKISARDINTLQRIYKQPTRLGWKIEAD